MLREEIRPSYQRRRHATDKGTIEERRVNEVDPVDARNMFRSKNEKESDSLPTEQSIDAKENLAQKKSSSIVEEGGKGS